jgi:nitrous oxidase accessory protein NosD
VDGAGILVNSSRDVEIYHNTVDGNANGIAAVQSARGTGRYGDYRVTNLYVHDNVITLDRGSTGLVQNEGSSAVFQDSTNRFRNNRYTIGYAGRPFAWNDRTFSFSQWQALGHDQQGSASTP